MNENKPLSLVSVEEQAQISRVLRAWLNQFPDLPVAKVDFESLGEEFGVALSTIQAAYKTRRYIDGTYQAQYQFKIIYRLIATTTDERLKADEVLNRMGAWAETETKPDFGENIRVRQIRRDTESSLFDRYDNNVEDHQILMTLIYEVI